MGPRRSFLVIALLLLPASARADRHNWEANASASRASGSALWGGSLSLARTIPIKGSHRLSAFGDFGKHGGEHAGSALSQTAALFGLRYVPVRTLKKYPLFAGAEQPYRYRLQFFGQAAGGVVDTSSQGTHQAWLLGVGVDGLFSHYGGVRAQVDKVWFSPDSGRKDFVRISIGVLYRFEHEHR
jgi:hypothetical protein